MASSHERQLKEHNQEVKKEHDTRFSKGEKHLHLDANVYEDWMETITNPQHMQQQQQQTQEGLQVIELQTKRMATQFVFQVFRLTKLEVPPSRPKFIEGFPFEFELGKKMVQELGSSTQGSGDFTTWTSTPKSVEEVVVEVMKANKTTDFFRPWEF